MTASYQNPTNLAIQLQNIYAQEQVLLAELGVDWSLYRFASGLYQAKRVLNNEQIKALPTTSLEIAPAPGAGRGIYPLFATMNLDWTANYASIDAGAEMGLVQNGAAGASLGILACLIQNSNSDVSLFLAGSDDTGAQLPPISIPNGGTGQASTTFAWYLSNFDNKSLILKFGNGATGNLTAGHADNTLTVNVYYWVLNV